MLRKFIKLACLFDNFLIFLIDFFLSIKKNLKNQLEIKPENECANKLNKSIQIKFHFSRKLSN